MPKLIPGLLGVAILSLAACSGQSGDEGTDAVPAETEDAGVSVADSSFAWPDSLKVMGDGFPEAGDSCRRLGESTAVVDYLDHTSMLVGCPGSDSSEAAQKLVADDGAKIVGKVDGVTLLSLPAKEPETAPAQAEKAAKSGSKAFSGTITGNEIVRHSFHANEGQTINVTLSGRGTMYFNVLPPEGGPGDAIYVGSRATDNADFWSGVAPASGDYTVVIYLMGNDRDTDVSRSYELEAIAE